MNQIKLPLAELKPALIGLGKIISRRATLPVLGMLKIERTRDGWITLTSTDLDRFITVRLEEPSQGQPATVLVPYEDLNTLAKAGAKGESLTVEKASDDKAIIRYPIGDQQAEEHVLSASPDDFPSLPKIKTEPVSIPGGVRDSIHQAMRCASTEETRAILNGTYIDVSKPDCHQVVATDGRSLYSSNSFNLPLKDSVLISSHRFLGWKEFCADGEWQMRVQPGMKKDDAGWLQLSSRRWRYISRQQEGNFPNWRQCVPAVDSYKREIRFDLIDALIQTIERIPDGDKINHALTVEVIGGKVFFIGQSSAEPVRVEIASAKTTSADGYVRLNREYLLRAFDFGLTRLQIIDEMSPVRLTDDAGHQMIIMPVRPFTPPTSSAPAPAAPVNEPNGAEASAVPPPPTTERINTPMQTTASTHQNGVNPNPPDSTVTLVEKSPIEQALDQIESIKGTMRGTVTSLNGLADSLRQIHKERRLNEREIRSVRDTLKTLQTVRL